MKKTKYLLTLLAAGTILTAGIGQAMAYFTTYVEAEGGFTIRLGDETKIVERLDEWVKELSVVNEEGSEPVWVRAKAFYSPNTLELDYSGEGWSKGEDDYYYYNSPVNAGEGTKSLYIEIKNRPKDVAQGDVLNVIVIYESTPVLYREDGSTYADWSSEFVTTGRTEGSMKKPETVDKDKDENKPENDNKDNQEPENTTDTNGENQVEGGNES